MFITIDFFQASKNLRKEMQRLFKEKGITGLKEKRFILGEALGYAPNFKDMTVSELELVVTHLKNMEGVAGE
ncbi:hypothetical protein [Bacillus thuringiensis]|uniref:hypothetical protein n=1 Tax=Bacillus thuringiensis TaxID=1428 RepID=UPI000BFD9278|nr:hypothetical protein [Bacillus thuringiensis]PGT90120.1 hypothetical protein COD17_10245 [Bacillus thuringiensis]